MVDPMMDPRVLVVEGAGDRAGRRPGACICIACIGAVAIEREGGKREGEGLEGRERIR